MNAEHVIDTSARMRVQVQVSMHWLALARVALALYCKLLCYVKVTLRAKL